MSNTAFGVAQTSAGVGTTDTDMRKIIAAQWESTGVIDGLAVTGTTSLYYKVAEGVAVCSKGPSDGKTLAYFSGGNTSTVSANSSGNPRIDSVYIYSNDANQGDADNLVHIGVASGTAAAVPTAPTIPTYATLLAEMLVPAGATTTANATQAASIGYAIPYGGTLGLLGEAALNADREVSTGGSWTDFYTVAATVTVPSRHLVRVDYRATLSTPGGNTGWTRVRPYLTVDGAEVKGSRRKWPAWTGPEFTHSSSCVAELAAGTHTVELHLAYDGGDWGLSIVDGGTGGAALSVWDEGAA